MTQRTPTERQYWLFEFYASEVLKAVDKKIDYHQSRLKFWKDEESKAASDLKEKGVEFRESPNMNNSYSTQQGVQVVIDPQRQSYLSNCQTKVKEHQQKLHEYETYQTALSRVDGNYVLNLTVADMEFFNL